MSLTRRLKVASQMLDRVGIQNREYYLPGQLSGGQAQCAAIARALVNSPTLIIADEPTGNLDSGSSRLVMELLADIHKMGNTILFVTHNPELTRFATRVVYMHDGSIIHDEKTALGQVAITARRVLYTLPTTNEEDDLAGVSALMKALPGKSPQRPKRRKSVAVAKKAKSTTRRQTASTTRRHATKPIKTAKLATATTPSTTSAISTTPSTPSTSTTLSVPGTSGSKTL
jgi:putative ABC transport system ATP-binding protein